MGTTLSGLRSKGYWGFTLRKNKEKLYGWQFHGEKMHKRQNKQHKLVDNIIQIKIKALAN